MTLVLATLACVLCSMVICSVSLAHAVSVRAERKSRTRTLRPAIRNTHYAGFTTAEVDIVVGGEPRWPVGYPREGELTDQPLLMGAYLLRLRNRIEYLKSLRSAVTLVLPILGATCLGLLADQLFASLLSGTARGSTQPSEVVLTLFGPALAVGSVFLVLMPLILVPLLNRRVVEARRALEVLANSERPRA